MYSATHRRAFSLVELSIVLVILGLLVGGVLAGQSLIRAAELRAVSAEHARYITAVHSFRDKYFALPGDINNATAFWGTDANCAGTYTGATAAAGTCNGNGNGLINTAAAASSTGEWFQFWKQLALAGLIEGSYTGFAGTITNEQHIGGQNAPRSRMPTGVWATLTNPSWTGNGVYFDGIYNNFMVYGRATNWDPSGQVLKPEEAWNIDTKMDDGLPARGKMIIRNWSTCTTATASSQLTATYLLTSNSVACTLIWPQVF